MDELTWHGVTKAGILNETTDSIRQDLASAAKAYDWNAVLTIELNRYAVEDLAPARFPSCA
ncbi:MAG: hypothetical protein ABIK89_13115 [Planctomycetota bacterium]